MVKSKQFLLDYWDIILFTASLTIKALFYGKQISDGYFSYRALLPAILCSVLLITSFSFLLGKRKRIVLLIIFDCIFSLMMICDINYYRYFKDVLSIPVIRNSLLLKSVKSSISSLFKATDLLFAADIFIWLLFLYLSRQKKRGEMVLIKRVAVFITFFILALSINGYKIYALSKEQPRLLSTMYNRIYVAKQLGNINFHYIDAYNFIQTTLSKSKPLSQQKENEIKSYMEEHAKTTPNKFTGIAKGKNLIVIQVEALQQFVINKKINGQVITPNLNRWLQKSMYFQNYYYQVSSGGTSDAEFTSNNSLFPAPSGAAYYLYSENEYSSLPQTLKKQGYGTSVLHGYTETFWNRNAMYKAMQYDNFFSDRSYKIDDKVGLGLSDASFLRQSLDKLEAMKKPNYSFIITLSSHFPYDDTKHYGTFDAGEYEGTLLGNYLKAIHYTDAQLGTFLDNLEKKGLMDDSIIVLYGDHNAIPKDDEKELYKFMNITEPNDLEWAKLQKVPMFIHYPKNAFAGTQVVSGGQMDLYPTLMNLFGLSCNYAFGHDLLDDNSKLVTFRNGSFTDGTHFYLSQLNAYYDMTSGKEINETRVLKDEKNQVMTQLEYSDEILRHNLINNFNKQN